MSNEQGQTNCGSSHSYAAKERDKLVFQWINRLSSSELRYALVQCAFALIDDEQIAFRCDDYVDENGRRIPEDEVIKEGLYWKANGELITEPDA